MYIPSSIYYARSLVPARRPTKVFYIMQNSCLGSMRAMPIEYIEVTTLRECAVGSVITDVTVSFTHFSLQFIRESCPRHRERKFVLQAPQEATRLNRVSFAEINIGDSPMKVEI